MGELGDQGERVESWVHGHYFERGGGVGEGEGDLEGEESDGEDGGAVGGYGPVGHVGE